MVKKKNIGRHKGTASNPLKFKAAYKLLSEKPGNKYQTTGNKRTFVATATTGKKGCHKGEQVIIFKSNGTEMARAYKCCWGHKTNCNGTYIDCYTQAIIA